MVLNLTLTTTNIFLTLCCIHLPIDVHWLHAAILGFPFLLPAAKTENLGQILLPLFRFFFFFCVWGGGGVAEGERNDEIHVVVNMLLLVYA